MAFTNRVTIAVPVFERKEYFQAAIESALNQSVKCNVIVVDNASSHTYFKDYCEKYNLPYFRNHINIGMFPNWNKCFINSKSEFVMILGDDDFLEPNFIESFLKSYERYSDLDIWFSNFRRYLYGSKETKTHKHRLPFGFNKGGKVLEYGVKYNLGFPVISSVIRKGAFNGFYEDAHGSNDWHWIYSNIGSLNVYGEESCLLNYGSHPKQDTKNTKTIMKTTLSIAYIYEEVLFPQMKQQKLKEMALKKGKSAFDYFLGIASDDFLISLSQEDHIYARYFRKKNQKIGYYLASQIPKSIRWIGYRSLRKLNLIENFGVKS